MPHDTRGIGTHLAPPTPEENATCPRCGGDYRRLDCRSTERCHAPIERTTDDRHPLSRDPKEAPPMPHESHNEAVKPRSAWMFWEHPDGTLYRQTQVIDTAFARVLAAAGWTRFRRHMERLLDRWAS